jgi:hypothetical protein
MTEDDKILVWLDYVVTTAVLKHDIGIGKLNHHTDLSNKVYKNLGVYTYPMFPNIVTKSFEDFCNDNREIPETLNGWYCRFKGRIKLNK